MKRILLTSSLVIASCAVSSASELFVDFNNYSNDGGLSFDAQALIDFNSGGSGAGGARAFDGIGLDGSVGFQGGQFFAGYTATQKAGTVTDTSSDFTITHSIYFLTESTPRSNSNDDIISLGVGDQTVHNGSGGFGSHGGYFASYADNFVNAGLRMTDPSTLAYSFTASNATDSFSSTVAGGTLAVDTWYFFTAELAYDSLNNEWDITQRIQESDSSGSIVGAGLDVSNSVSLSNPFAANPTLYSFFGGENASPTQSNSAGIKAFDNLTLNAIPEPSSYALISGALALGWIMIRRRK